MRRRNLWVTFLMLTAGAPWAQATEPDLSPESAARFAGLALKCVHQEYPNKISHVLASDADAVAPRLLYPAFHGCYDWHSSVHGHWLLVRLVRQFPGATFEAQARAALGKSLTASNLAAEAAYLEQPGRASF